jgi:vacuolar iron transporter family protein
MAEKHSTSDQPNSRDVARYRANYLAEQEGIYLYNKLAEVESDAHLAELYRHLAAIEQRHADLWKDYLTGAGETPPTYMPNWRTRTLIWIARHLGTGAVLSTISSMEKRAMTDYDTQPEAVTAGLPADERSPACLATSSLRQKAGSPVLCSPSLKAVTATRVAMSCAQPCWGRAMG